jgi:hypothetical protein
MRRNEDATEPDVALHELVVGGRPGEVDDGGDERMVHSTVEEGDVGGERAEEVGELGELGRRSAGEGEELGEQVRVVVGVALERLLERAGNVHAQELALHGLSLLQLAALLGAHCIAGIAADAPCSPRLLGDVGLVAPPLALQA